MIDVSCAIIIDESGRVLSAQRSALMALPLKWEFPGGKVEQGETPKESLLREIQEELELKVAIIEQLSPNSHTYGSVAVRLIPFVCTITAGTINLKEHAAYRWLNPNELLDLDWAEADIPIVKAFLNLYDENRARLIRATD